MPFDFYFIADGLLPWKTARHTLHNATVLASGSHVNSVGSLSLVQYTPVLIQNDYMLTPYNDTFLACISVMTSSDFVPLIFVSIFGVLHGSVLTPF
jgi:hypothetical protein